MNTTREILKLIHGDNDLSHYERMGVDGTLYARYEAYCSWNPYSERMIKYMGYDSYDLEYFEVDNQWMRHYPGGIPPRGSREWQRHMTKFPWDKEYGSWDDGANPSIVYLELFPDVFSR